MKCGIKLVPGVTDAVQGDRHLSLLKMASRYALEYNEIILQRCNL